MSESVPRHLTTSQKHTLESFPGGYFISGTDTGVGKTVVAAAVATGLRLRGVKVGVMKPIETGVQEAGEQVSDGRRLCSAAGVTDARDMVSPYRFGPPLAPLAAARVAGIEIEPQNLLVAFRSLASRYAMVLVEGVGGVMVPIAPNMFVVDLMGMLGLPVLLVARPTLGSVNHALLSLRQLKDRAIPLAGIVLNRTAMGGGSPEQVTQERSTVALIKELTGVPVFGPLPYVPDLLGHWEAGMKTLCADPAFKELLTEVTPTPLSEPERPL